MSSRILWFSGAVAGLVALLLCASPAFTEGEEKPAGGSYEKRKTDQPMDWDLVEIILIDSNHDTLEPILKDRGYPYYYIKHRDFTDLLKEGAVGGVRGVDAKGKEVKLTLRLNPAKQIMIFGCSDFINILRDNDIQRIRRFVAEGGFVFTHCWGYTLQGQAFPDYVNVRCINSNPDNEPKDLMDRQTCVLNVDPKAHPLFGGLENIGKEIDFTFSGARQGKLLRDDIEVIYQVKKGGIPVMTRFTFTGDPSNWKEGAKSGGKPKKSTSGGKEEDEPQPGQVMNFLPHFAEQREADPEVADMRDTIFYNFLLLKQARSLQSTKKKK